MELRKLPIRLNPKRPASLTIIQRIIADSSKPKSPYTYTQQDIDEHLRFLRSIFQGRWKNPKVTEDDQDPEGWCQVHCTIPFSITHGAPRYHYMAPCRIIRKMEEIPDTYEVEIRYRDTAICTHYNGERLRLHVCEMWTPFEQLNSNQIAA